MNNDVYICDPKLDNVYFLPLTMHANQCPAVDKHYMYHMQQQGRLCDTQLCVFCTVEPVFEDHSSRDQVIVVSINRWSLRRGANLMF